ncbi:MAG: 30S ribosomal protein S6 [Bacteroidetes bacterium]|nr:30S ribosomal protein S6 [Bacteroidota bacterium]
MTEKQKRVYEALFIINATLDDPTIEGIIQKTNDFLTTNGAEIVLLNKWGRKRFAYPIKKKSNGYYTLFEFKHSGEIIHQLERFFHLEEEIYRFLVIKLDKKALLAKTQPKKVEEGVSI